MAVRIGFIGTGGIANMHLNILPHIERANLIAFSDIAIEKAKTAANRYGGRAYSDFIEMLDQEDLDAVYICIPPFAHGAPERAVIEREIPMFVEKPISTDLFLAQEIRDLIRDTDLITSVGYNLRYMNIADTLTIELAGLRPSIALGYWIGGTPGIAWWRTRSGSGGQIVEQTTHVIDFARYILGEVSTVYATGSTGLIDDIPNFDIEDGSSVSLTFKNGAVATILSSCVANQGYGNGIHFITKGKNVKIEGDQLIIEEQHKKTIIKNGNDPYKFESEIFLKAVETGDKSAIRSSYADSINSLQITLAANESLDSGQVVNI